MNYSESKNRNSLIRLDLDLKEEPNNHICYKERRVRTKKYSPQRDCRDGWYEYKVTRTQIVLRREDPDTTAYEKRLWQLFFRMGFPYINKSGKNVFYYGEGEKNELSFSLWGRDKDNYSFVYLDCFTYENRDQLDTKLIIMQQEFVNITNHLSSLFNDDELAYKYIVAIKGFELTDEQEQIINDCHFTVLTEVDVEYFEELYTNLQDAAFFQFCGKIFEGMTIPKINTRIPAIRGRMGGHRYYAFSIDPQVLLRLSFVLHKTKAHEQAMPSYQRLVKKSRLKSITDFLNNHGFFPNSVVINLDEECEFELAEENNNDYDTEIGHLIIPQKYRVAYIIDGQHRLMGYAGCRWANQQIPVVAFENLNKSTQVKLFMEMNENQKAVPKELRLTLLKDLLPTDPRVSQRMYGLRLQIVFSFADHHNSPLRGYVGDGVDKKEFTLEYLQQALNSSTVYFGTINRRKETLDNPGIFFRGKTDDLECFEQARIAIRDFLFMCVRALIEGLVDVESLEDDNRRNVFIRNIGMNGFLRFVADVVEYKTTEILPTIKDNDLTANPETVFNIVRPCLNIIFDYMRNCPSDEGKTLRTYTGGKAPVQYQRTFQRELHEIHEDFNPVGLEDWIISNSSEVVEEALGIVQQLRQLIKLEFFNRFSDKGVTDWVTDSLPEEISHSCFERQRTFNQNATPEQIHEKTLWDFVNDEDYFKIACHSTNDPLIKEDFTYPGMRKSARRNLRYNWIKEIFKIEKACIENHICETDNINELRELYNHFVRRGLIQETSQDFEF